MPRKKSQAGHNSAAAQELRTFIERLERVLGEIDDLKDDVKSIRAEAKARGYDVKAIARIVAERRETDAEKAARRETEEITDVYRAALGMLDGTPLGDAARRRLDENRRDDDDEPPPAEPATSEITKDDLDRARDDGRAACRSGRKVIENPYVAGDPRRAAWDEGWCFEAGSDGMDVPDAWKRRAPPKEQDPATDDGDGRDGEA